MTRSLRFGVYRVAFSDGSSPNASPLDTNYELTLFEEAFAPANLNVEVRTSR